MNVLKQVPHESPPDPEQIELGTLLTEVGRRWRIIVATGVAILAATILWLFIAAPSYEARMTVVRIDAVEHDRGLQSLGIGQLGGMAGLRLGKEEGNSAYGKFRRILNSGALAERLEQRYNLMGVIYANRWDAQHSRWKPPDGLKSRFSIAVNQLLGQPGWTTPRPETDLANYIKANLVLNVDTSGDYITLTYRNSNRNFALYMLTSIYQQADALVRERELRNTESSLAYLRARFLETTNITYQQIFAHELAALERQLMMLRGDRPYSVEVFDGPYVPLQPSQPRPLLYTFLAAGIGLMLGLLIAIMHASVSGQQYDPRWPGERVLASVRSAAQNVRRHFKSRRRYGSGR
jgi:hypothetical protein